MSNDGKNDSPFLKLGLELGPLVVFFLANSKAHLLVGGEASRNIFYATGFFMAAIIISLAVSYWKFRRIPTMPLVTAGFVMIFGALTLYLNDEIFIKIKPTLVNSLFAVVLLSAALLRKPLLKRLFDGAFDLTDEGWMILTWRWGLFFVALAILNELVWRNFSTDTWVSFKLFGIMPLTLLFGVLQLPILTRHACTSDKKGF